MKPKYEVYDSKILKNGRTISPENVCDDIRVLQNKVSDLVGTASKVHHEPIRPLKRPPCVLMTSSAAMEANGEALKKVCDAGYEVIIVQDPDLEDSIRIVERVRAETVNRNTD